MSAERAALAIELRGFREAKGHAVDNARMAADRLAAAFADGSIAAVPPLDRMLADIQRALDQGEGQRLGGKSAEAARFILDAIIRELERGG